MTAVTSDRPAFPPLSGGTHSRTTAAKALRDAQAAFFRPSLMASTDAGVTEAMRVPATASPTLISEDDRSRLRPGSLLDIRV